MNAPRVLVSGVVLGQPVGGVRRHNAELLPRAGEELARRGGHLTVVEGLPAIPFPLGEHVERVSSDVPLRPIWKRWLREGPALRKVLRAAASRSRPYQLWHTAHLPVPNIGLPYALTLHDLRDLVPGLGGPLRRSVARCALKRAIENARVVIVVSEAVRDELLERYRVRSVALVPNAGDHFTPEPRRTPSEPFLLHVGHLEPRKNVELLLEALALDAELPDLVLAGASKGDSETRLRGLAQRLGVGRRVRWLGAVTDERLAALYAETSCVVLPSRVEGFGIPVLEAQLAGAPLAVSCAGALGEVAGADVPRFSPDSPSEATAAIRRALATSVDDLERARRRAGERRWQTSAELLVEAWCAACEA